MAYRLRRGIPCSQRSSCGAALVLSVLLAACNGGLQTLRGATYPEDFHYITRSEIRSNMGALAFELNQLDQIMAREGAPGVEDQEAIVALLSNMKVLAKNLKRREHSNHPLLDRYASQLQGELDRALLNARKSPPNYYQAGEISGSCSSCHGARRDDAHGAGP